jgi:FdhD protein
MYKLHLREAMVINTSTPNTSNAAEFESIAPVTVERITPVGRAAVEDVLLREERFVLYVDGERKAEFECLPRDLDALAVGHCVVSGLLSSVDELASLSVEIETRIIRVELRKITTEASISAEQAVFTAEDVHKLQEQLNRSSTLFHRTGAAHSAALAGREKLLIFIEDVARHNALDKLIGRMVLDRITPSGKLVLLSSRLSEELVAKVAAGGIQVVAVPGAPTFAAVQLANRSEITLLAFVRPDNINIYTHHNRIL